MASPRHRHRTHVSTQSQPYCDPAVAVKGSDRERVVVRLPCKTWACACCGPKRRKRLTAQFIRGRPNHFLTCTIRRSQEFTERSHAERLSQAWQKIRELINREATRDPQVTPLPYGAEPEGGWLVPAHGSIPTRVRFPDKRLQFGAAFEPHKSGVPHLHILLRFEWIDYRWLRAQFVAEIASPQFRDEPIESDRKAAAYVTKYLTKNPTRFGNCKRYWFSRSYALTKWERRPRFENIEGAWTRDPTPFADKIAFLSWEGYSIEHVCDGAAIVRAPPGDTEETHPVYDLEAHVRDKANEVEQRKASARAWHDARAEFRD